MIPELCFYYGSSSPMSDATVLHGGPIYEGELAVLIKAHIWGVHWLFGCYDFGPKTANFMPDRSPPPL